MAQRPDHAADDQPDPADASQAHGQGASTDGGPGDTGQGDASQGDTGQATSRDAPRDTADFFQTDHLQTGLRTRAVRGGAITMAAQAMRIPLRLAGLAVLARLLAKGDFGLIYQVLAVTSFITLFREAGLATATIQKRDVTDAQVSTLFWINLALAAVVALVVAALGPPLAWFYNNANVADVTFALAGSVLIAGLSVQHIALLRRQMRFGRVALIEMIALVCGLGSAIIAAWQFDAGYWALVVEQYGQATARVIVSFIMCPWLPKRPRRRTGVRPLLAFGGNLTGSTVLNYVSRNADNVLIGRFAGEAALGAYGNAYRLLMAPFQNLVNPARGVALPTLSRLQDQPARFSRYYYQALALIVFFGMPIACFAFAEAPRVVRLLLGPGWDDAAMIFRALGPAAFLGTFSFATGWVYVALGHTDRQLRWNIVATALDITAFIVGLRWGAFGVAAAFSVAQVLLRGPALWYCYRGTFLRLRTLAVTLARPAVASIGAAAIVMGLRELVQPAWPVAVELVSAGIVYVLVYLGLWFAMPGGRAEMAANFRIMRELRQRRAAVRADQQTNET